MSLGQLVYYLRLAIENVLILSAPVLIIGVVVGLLIAIFQATTSLQDQTLSFVPKILAIFLALLLFGTWMLTGLEQMTSLFFSQLAQIP